MLHDEFMTHYNAGFWTCLICNEVIYLAHISRHVKHQHQLTVKEYYDKFVSCNKICSNEYCENFVEFSGRLDRGYNKYCSRSCQCQHRSLVMWRVDYDFYKNSLNKVGKENLIKTRLRSMKTTISYVYLLKLGSLIKIGVTKHESRIRGFYPDEIIKLKRLRTDIAFKLERKLLSVTSEFSVHYPEFGDGHTELRSISALSNAVIKSFISSSDHHFPVR